MKKIYILAAAAAIITAVLLYFYLDSLTEKKDGAQDSVVIAVVDVPAYTKITADMVALVEMPSSAIHPNAIHNRADAVGMVISSDLVAGEVLLQSKVKDMGTSDDALAYLIEDGMRAISFEVDNDTGLGGYLRQGDKVDVYTTTQVNDLKNTGTSGSGNVNFLVAENLTVLAVGTTIADSTSPESGAIEYISVTVMSDPETAQVIAFSDEIGEIHLSLRSPIDESTKSYTYQYKLNISPSIFTLNSL